MGRRVLAGFAVLALVAAGWFLGRPTVEDHGPVAVSLPKGGVPSKPGAVEAPAVAAPPVAAGEGGADGYLLRSRTGTVIPGTVTATTRAGVVVTARAGADGVFRLRGLPRGESVRIEYASPGLLTLVSRVLIPREQFLDLGYVFLGEGQVLEVLAVDGTGRPVEGCAVTAAAFSYRSPLEDVEDPGVPEASAVTDAEGRAVLPPVSPGVRLVEGTAPGFARAGLMVNVIEGALRTPVRLVLAPGFFLEGRVLHADGKPAAGVRVAVDPSPAAAFPLRPPVAVADAEGRFRVEGLPRGKAGLSVVAVPGILETAPGVEIPAPGPVEIRLLPRTAIAGRVVEDGAEAPIAGAEVMLQLAEPQTRERAANTRTATGPDGTFRFENLPALPVETISAAKEGYFRAREPVPPGEGKEWTIPLRKGAVVRGVVRDGAGAAVSLAWVRLSCWKGRDGIDYLPDVRSDEAGRYEIPGAPPGRGLLEAGARNRHLPGVPEDTWEALKGGEVPENCGVDVPAEGTVEKDLVLAADSRIEGRILHADGTPAPGYVAALQEADSTEGFPWGAVASAADGSFVLEDLFPAARAVIAAVGPEGRLGVSAPFDIVESEVVRGITVTLSTPGTLRGRVLGEDGKPAPGATLRLVPKRYDPQRDWEWRSGRSTGIAVPVSDDGSFASGGLAPGPWTPVATAPDRIETRAEAVDLHDGETREGVEILLAQGFALEGRVLDPSGGPAAGARVVAEREGEEEGRPSNPEDGSATVIDGRFRIGGLPAGAYRVRATKEGCLPAVVRVETGGEEVVLRLKEGLSIQGRAVEQGTGKPAAGVTLYANRMQGEPGGEETGDSGGEVAAEVRPFPVAPDGTFLLRGLAPGDYFLRFQSDSGAYAPKYAGGVAAGTKDLVVELQRGLSIAGKVVDAGGLPLDLRGLTVELSRPEAGASGAYLREEEIEAGGAFALEGLSPGRYRLTFGSRVWNDGAGVYASRSVEAEAGTKDLVVPLSRGKAITGWVLQADGTPPPEENFEVTLHPSGGGETARAQESVLVDERMFFRTDPLPEGVPFDLEVKSSDTGLVASVREVMPGASGVVLRLEKGLTIRGKALDPEGKPAGGVEVFVRSTSRSGIPGTATAGEDGTFTIEGLAPGIYRLYARSEDRNLAPVDPEGAVAAGTEGAVVRTAKGFEFRARCSSADGKPLPQVQAFVEEFLDGRWEGPFVVPVRDGALLLRGLPKCRVRVRLFRTPGPVDDGDSDPAAGPFEVPGEEAALTLPR